METSFDCTLDVNTDNVKLDCYLDLLFTERLTDSELLISENRLLIMSNRQEIKNKEMRCELAQNELAQNELAQNELT